MSRSNAWLLSLVLLVGLAAAGLIAWDSRTTDRTAPGSPAMPPATAAAEYLGSARCIECHAEAGKAWQGSQHALAMQVASEATVLGRFDGRTLVHGPSRSRVFRRDGQFRVETQGADGRLVDVEVSHTFGLEPLQQYLVTLPDGRKQALGLAWDSRPAAAGGQRWFHLFPDGGTQPGHPLHWAGIDQNWNYQCADCHSTGLRKGYDAAGDRFATTWSEMNVACEACHGPGSVHAQWAAKPAAQRPLLPGLGLTAQLKERTGVSWQPDAASGTARRSAARGTRTEIEVCARCHARRGQVSDAHRAGDALLDAFRPALLEPGLYHVDGQQRDEVYDFASFLQSRMHAAGVTCADCHDPHSGKLRAAGNAVCARCHEPGRFDTAAHHHHSAGGAGAQCAACHMPTATYMGVDPRHDHSLRIPRPDRSVALGTPNACTQCHRDRTAPWAAAAVRQWFAHPKPGYQGFAEAFHAAEMDAPGAAAGLLAIVADPAQSAIARASAVARMGERLSPTPLSSSLSPLAAALDDADDLLRLAAVQALAGLEPSVRAHHLGPRLMDVRRVVRIEAARALAGPSERLLSTADQAAFGRAWAEFLAAAAFNADRPEAHARLADAHAARGDADAATAEYRQALRRDPSFVPAWVNLAGQLEQAGRAGEALQLLRDGQARNPRSAELQHALGLALIRSGDRKQALGWLASAARGAADNVRFAYVLAVATHDSGEPAAALKLLRAAHQRRPYDRDVLLALVSYEREAGDLRSAARAADALRDIEPQNPAYVRLAAQLAEALQAKPPQAKARQGAH